MTIITRIRTFINSLMLRRPSKVYRIIALSGNAVMVWTPTGNIVLPSAVARRLSTQLDLIAEKAEEYHDNYNSI